MQSRCRGGWCRVYRVARRAVSVAVLEQQTVGWGASGRNGGQVNPMPPFSGPDEMSRAAGVANTQRIAHAYIKSGEQIRYTNIKRIRGHSLHSVGSRVVANWMRFFDNREITGAK